MNPQAATHRPAPKGPSGAREELAFLPAALEIEATPPSPLGRALLWTLMGLCVSAVAWASFGHVDIVAVAAGKVVPNDRVKVIQSVGLGTVKAIHVTDGQRVRRGAVLLELDPTLAEADRTRTDEQLRGVELELVRQQAFAEWLRGGAATTPTIPAALRDEATPFGALQRAMLNQACAEHRAQLDVIEQSLARRQADLEATRRQVEKLERTLPLIAERAASMRRLAEQKLFPQTQYLEVEQQRIETEQDLATERANLESVRHALNELAGQRRTRIAQTEHETLDRIEELNRSLAELRQEHVKTAQVATQQRLTAPVDGEVQQLSIHTVGGVVKPGDPLMVIVPEEAAVEVEALVLNKDIGFVRDGQAATVKVESFPFTRYGVIEGELTSVSDDALQDERLGLVYAVRVRLAKADMNIDGRTVRLSPGMGVTVEVMTGQRRIVEYLLSPIARRASESMRER